MLQTKGAKVGEMGAVCQKGTKKGTSKGKSGNREGISISLIPGSSSLHEGSEKTRRRRYRNS